jgi:hypothetical protein
MRQVLRVVRRGRLWLIVLALLALALPVGIAQVVGAATINVAGNGNDTATCGGANAPCRTIAFAVSTRATTGDTVAVGAGTFAEGISIGKAITITGAGAGNTKIDGGGTNQPVKVAAGINATLQRLTIQNGGVPPTSGVVSGGGIDNAGVLSLSDVVVSGNSATGNGGGIANRANASLNLHNVTISGNKATSGGGIANDAGGTVSGDATTISGNIVTDIGGAIINRSKGVVTLTNSTISGNKIFTKGTTTLAGGGGGIDSFGATVIGTNVTFAGNASSVGNDGVSTDGGFTLKNSIVADGCAGKVISGDYNIGGTTALPCGFTGPHDQPNVNPLLAPLADNGGPTQTHALMPGSPAIDKGGSSANQCPAVDQRGTSRPQGAACDSGAFELEVATQPTATATATATATSGAGGTPVACTPLAPGSPFANDAFKAQYDQGEAITPNFWGPPGTPPGLMEKYAESPGGQRLVQYFDKGRMELTNPANGTVTNGLLANELITGLRQLGDNVFETHPAAAIPIAGDPDNPGPTYASLSGKASGLLAAASPQIGSQVTTVVAADGTVMMNGSSFGNANITTFDDATKHNVPGVFVDYRNKAGLQTIGYAKSEPFLATVKVGGAPKQVMVQVFERRVLTYTPDNPDAFKVEMGNIGQHYYRWRYCTA